MSRYHHVQVDEIKAETDKAFLFLIDGEEYWVPKGQLADPDDYEKGDKDCEIAITEWIAREKGLL